MILRLRLIQFSHSCKIKIICFYTLKKRKEANRSKIFGKFGICTIKIPLFARAYCLHVLCHHSSSLFTLWLVNKIFIIYSETILKLKCKFQFRNLIIQASDGLWISAICLYDAPPPIAFIFSRPSSIIISLSHHQCHPQWRLFFNPFYDFHYRMTNEAVRIYIESFAISHRTHPIWNVHVWCMLDRVPFMRTKLTHNGKR